MCINAMLVMMLRMMMRRKVCTSMLEENYRATLSHNRRTKDEYISTQVSLLELAPEAYVKAVDEQERQESIP